MSIVTSDLRTGLEVGRTAWSGPGTLTLSSLTAALHNNIHKRASAGHSSHLSPPYQSALLQPQVQEDVEVFSVPPQHRGDRQQHVPPSPVRSGVQSVQLCSTLTAVYSSVLDSILFRSLSSTDIFII